MSEVMIRTVTKFDAFQLCHLLERATQETLYLLHDKMTVDQEEHLIEQYLHSHNSQLMVAEYQNELIGMANLIGCTQPVNCHVGEVGVCVLQAYWRHGIGSSLVEAIMDYAYHQQMRMLTLEVHADNTRAIGLYKKLGFSQCGYYKNRLYLNQTYCDTIAMEYDLLEFNAHE